VVMVSHIIKTAETYIVAGNSFEETSNYFMYPVVSGAVGIYKVNKPRTMRQTWTVNEIEKKCFVMPIPSVSFKPTNYKVGVRQTTSWRSRLRDLLHQSAPGDTYLRLRR